VKYVHFSCSFQQAFVVKLVQIHVLCFLHIDFIKVQRKTILLHLEYYLISYKIDTPSPRKSTYSNYTFYFCCYICHAKLISWLCAVWGIFPNAQLQAMKISELWYKFFYMQNSTSFVLLQAHKSATYVLPCMVMSNVNLLMKVSLRKYI
jgi:hypothetical protein